MNELVKSIRVGSVDFFGIIIPGVLLITMCTFGFFMPLLLLIMDMSNVVIDWQEILSKNATLIFSILTIFSYALGYILRLSSPDELDEKSAKMVIRKEMKKNKKFEEDGWPYDLKNQTEKYPYSRFRDYLKKRGHDELIKDLVTWCPDEDIVANAVWEDEKDFNGGPIPKTKRSKTSVNEMKMKVRVQSPELSALIDSKEGHVRLMAGTWAAFNLAIILVAFAFLIVTAVCLFPQQQNIKLNNHYYPIFWFVNLNLLLMMIWSNYRIQQLFHYRRVNELFHIVESAYLAQKTSQNSNIQAPIRSREFFLSWRKLLPPRK